MILSDWTRGKQQEPGHFVGGKYYCNETAEIHRGIASVPAWIMQSYKAPHNNNCQLIYGGLG